jgi:hypothetical protein
MANGVERKFQNTSHAYKPHGNGEGKCLFVGGRVVCVCVRARVSLCVSVCVCAYVRTRV